MYLTFTVSPGLPVSSFIVLNIKSKNSTIEVRLVDRLLLSLQVRFELDFQGLLTFLALHAQLLHIYLQESLLMHQLPCFF